MLRPLILFTGPDASGKSTLANLLKRYLEKKGLITKIVRLRGTHTIAYVLMRLMRDVLRLYGDDLHYYKLKIPRRLTGFWIYVETASVLPLVILYYYMMRLKYAIISERSLIDLIIWIISGVNIRDYSILCQNPLKFLILLAIKHQRKTIYITANVDVLISRKPFDKALVLKMTPYYNAFAKYLELETINTSNNDPQRSLKLLISWLHERSLTSS